MLNPCVRRASQDNMRPMEFYTPYLKILLCVFELWRVCLSSYSKALAKLNVGVKEPYKRVTRSILILHNVFKWLLYTQRQRKWNSMMCDSDPINARIWWNVIFLIRWILVMGEREHFLNQSHYDNANAMLNFHLDMNANNHVSMNNV